ncbi:hypothetical protein V6V47_01250 [Micromonospora sp. CPCC 205539]|uniref:hypothetical protein n=1 Tax=Micromonospora sp. CPCC 205539 TaxID=3122408 RepID=UPI002FF3370D
MGHPHGTPPYAALAAGTPLECVIALGHDDEGDRNPPADPAGAGGTPTWDAQGTAGRHRALVAALRDRGYAVGPTAAARVLDALGRAPVADGCSTYLTHPDAFRPAPSEPGRPVVVRLVANIDGRQGVAAASALLDGLHSATVCMYLGHLRFGLGADFEPALPVTVAADSGLPAAPARLVRRAARDGRQRGERLEETLDRWLADGLIHIERAGASRVVLSYRNLVPSSATARLTHWVARRAPGGLPAPVFAEPAAEASPGLALDRHRLWVLLTCRATALFPALRRGLAPAPVWLIGPPDTVSLGEWRTLPWILDALCAGGPWAEVLSVLDARAYGGRLVLDAPPDLDARIATEGGDGGRRAYC